MSYAILNIISMVVGRVGVGRIRYKDIVHVIRNFKDYQWGRGGGGWRDRKQYKDIHVIHNFKLSGGGGGGVGGERMSL